VFAGIGFWTTICAGTRYAWVKPIEDKTAARKLAALKDMAFPLNSPKTLLSDNGTEFKNKKMAEYCAANRITQHFTRPYRPQSDGVVERFNRTILTLLRAYVDETGTTCVKISDSDDIITLYCGSNTNTIQVQ
jgi:transposase InsO family protein